MPQQHGRYSLIVGFNWSIAPEGFSFMNLFFFLVDAIMLKLVS